MENQSKNLRHTVREHTVMTKKQVKSLSDHTLLVITDLITKAQKLQSCKCATDSTDKVVDVVLSGIAQDIRLKSLNGLLDLYHRVVKRNVSYQVVFYNDKRTIHRTVPTNAASHSFRVVSGNELLYHAQYIANVLGVSLSRSAKQEITDLQHIVYKLPTNF